ncbi:MAG: glucuronate isomerase [Lachnospiraceae bacterium]|nr:glucuronate isomerase [Lachnospiraceae bacterium]
MKPFMDKDFLLQNDVAKTLYHQYATQVPVLDYHCHLIPQEIAEDIHFKNITELWLGADHYKWRVMRSNGVSERYITGDASDEEKFHAFAKALPKCIGNPMYHWCHLELQRYFGIYETLSEKNWKEIYGKCNEILQKPEMSAKNLIRMSNVTLVCTTDDPVDDLHYHEMIAADEDFEVQVLPAWRPDLVMCPEKEGYLDYINKLSEVSGISIVDFATLKKALVNRLDYFGERGCCISDHGLDYAEFRPVSEDKMRKLTEKSLAGEELSFEELLSFKTMVMLFLGAEYKKRNWAMQLHYGAKRENNEVVFQSAGANAGIDCINPKGFSAEVADFMNALNKEGNLPRTILYSLNPTDNALIGTMIGCFQGDNVRGKIQQGAAWWFNDHKYGMEEHMNSLASLSLLGNFIGMLTDSRSFISYPRHEYFRRILCNYIGTLVENGEYPEDYELLGELVQDISYYNAVNYFGFQL